MPPTPESLAVTFPDRVCAVVVTYNRKDLLRECLQALLAQSCPLARILVVNNVSTDGTSAMLAGEFPASRCPQIEVLDLPKNVGGAGGFHEGMKNAAARDFDWLWLMDDDTIVEPDSLRELFNARQRFPAGQQPVLLASKVVWTDGTLHSMNVPWPKLDDPEKRYLAAEHATMALRTATFVSVLMESRLVRQYGLPIADYFIWADDVEYTGRVLKDHFGVLVPASRVLHKTPNKHGTTDARPERFYLYVRNTVWMIFLSPAWTPGERVKSTVRLLQILAAYLAKTHYGLPSWQAIGRGLWDGATTRPQR